MASLLQTIVAKLNTWLGKKVDYDKAYGHQCVDFARQAAKDFGNPIGTFSGSAYNGWKTGSPFKGTIWKRVWYKPRMIPSVGDIVFFGPTKNNEFGHVAVVAPGSTISMISVEEQNAGGKKGWGTGTGNNAILKRTYGYVNAPVGPVLGWFTFQ